MSENKKDIAKNDTSSKKPASSGKKSGGFFAGIGKFFREYRSELKKISWPTFAEVVKNTVITLVMVLILGILIWFVDWGISALRDTLITKKDTTTPVTEISDSDAMTEMDYSELLNLISGSDVSSTDE